MGHRGRVGRPFARACAWIARISSMTASSVAAID